MDLSVICAFGPVPRKKRLVVTVVDDAVHAPHVVGASDATSGSSRPHGERAERVVDGGPIRRSPIDRHGRRVLIVTLPCPESARPSSVTGVTETFHVFRSGGLGSTRDRDRCVGFVARPTILVGDRMSSGSVLDVDLRDERVGRARLTRSIGPRARLGWQDSSVPASAPPSVVAGVAGTWR
jgi:hypothetical protein